MNLVASVKYSLTLKDSDLEAFIGKWIKFLQGCLQFTFWKDFAAFSMTKGRLREETSTGHICVLADKH